MSERTRNQYIPDHVSAPGETLQEILETRGMSQAELADRTGRPKKTINEIIKGKAAITPETALQLELVLGAPASFWNSRESQYREALAGAKGKQLLETQTDWLENIPYRAMAKLGWVPDWREKVKQLQEVLMFFGVASPDRWDDVWKGPAAAFRLSPTLASDPGAVAAWLRKGEVEAQKIQCAEYNQARFKVALSRIRALTWSLPREVPSIVRRECAAAGVRLVFVPELPGTRAWGATRWSTQTSATIQLSLRYKTDDHLWFTFFHEAGHVLLHGKRDVFLEIDEVEPDEKEREADSFALDWLIPAKEYRAFKRLGTPSCAGVSRFAHQVGIAAGIVVGRLQHDGLLPRTDCNNLKKRVDWMLAGGNE